MLTNSDVLIVGAGPTGLAAALTLADRGVGVTVVDAAQEGANTSRAAVVHARTLEVLEPSGVAAELVDGSVRVPSFEIRDGARTLGRLDLSTLPSRYGFAAMIPQSATEQILREALARRGVGVDWGQRVVDLDQTEDAVRVTLEGGGATRSVTAGLVLGADGMNSRVRETTGIGFPGSHYPQSFVLADVEMDWPVPDDTVSLTFSRHGLVVAAPLPGGRHRVVATADDPPERPTGADIEAVLQRRTGAGEVREVHWSGRFRVHHRLAERYRAGRVLLAGDAAHVHSPAGGQGMNTGIQDAVVLATLVADGADLDEYERRRRPVAQRVLHTTDLMTRNATRSATPARFVRNAAVRIATTVPPLRRTLALQIAELAGTRGR